MDITTNSKVILFNQHCIVTDRKIRIYGQYNSNKISKKQAMSIQLFHPSSGTHSVKTAIYKKRHDFYIEICSMKLWRSTSFELIMDGRKILDEIRLSTVSDNLKVNKGEAFIVCMLKDYETRVIEWINYNLSIGFTHIIIFNNNSTDNTQHKIEALNDRRVVSIPFNYPYFEYRTYEDTQGVAMAIGVQAFKKRCKWIALIDADEFIYFPSIAPMSMPRFLSKWHYRFFSALTMQSLLLTNKGNDEKFDNNLIESNRFTNGVPKYTKILINTRYYKLDDFIKHGHRLRGHLMLSMKKIMHYHLWCNERLEYNLSFEEKRELIDYKAKYLLRRTR
jgi:hypothetical protein